MNSSRASARRSSMCPGLCRRLSLGSEYLSMTISKTLPRLDHISKFLFDDKHSRRVNHTSGAQLEGIW